MPKVIIKRNTMVNSENDSILLRLPTSGFRRDNTVRSSLRMLGNRWKQSSKASLFKDDATRSSEVFVPFGKWYDNTELNVSPQVENLFKPKVEIKLELPIDKDLFNQRTSKFLMNSKILKHTMSLKKSRNEDGKGVQRTATIRKGSVWANSTSSKIFFHFVNSRIPCYHFKSETHTYRSIYIFSNMISRWTVYMSFNVIFVASSISYILHVSYH